MAQELHFGCMRPDGSHTDFDPDLRAIVIALAHYLLANPLACDSLEGMRRWWFDQEYQWPQYQLDKAAGWMKENQLIEEVAGSDGRARYRRIGSDEAFRLLLIED
jgi:hypothetical protein